MSHEANEGIPQYWVERFSGCETDCELEPDLWEEGRRESYTLSAPVAEKRLSDLCRAAESSAQVFFTTAFAYLASVFTAQEDVPFRTVLPNREGGEVVPFRVDVSE